MTWQEVVDIMHSLDPRKMSADDATRKMQIVRQGDRNITAYCNEMEQLMAYIQDEAARETVAKSTFWMGLKSYYQNAITA